MTKKLPVVNRLDHSGLKHHWQIPQCTHTRLQDPNKSFQKSQRCKLCAYWDVDGHFLCERHAGNRVLSALLSYKDQEEETNG